MIHNVHSQETATTQITTSQTNGICSYVVLKMSGWEKRMTSSYQKLVQSHLPKIGYSCYQHWWKSQHLDCKSIGRKQCWENTHSIKDIFIFLSAGLKKNVSCFRLDNTKSLSQLHIWVSCSSICLLMPSANSFKSHRINISCLCSWTLTEKLWI